MNQILQIKLRLSLGRQTDGLLKVAQLGKAEGNSPCEVVSSPEEKKADGDIIGLLWEGQGPPHPLLVGAGE